MRYDVKKFLFVGLESEKDAFFKLAQDAGIIHFIDANTKTPQSNSLPESAQRLVSSIKVLRGLPVAEQEETEDYEQTEEIVDKILELKEKVDALNEEMRIIKLEKIRVDAFGDFSLETIAQIEKEGNRKIQFYCAKQGFADDEDMPENVFYIASDHGLDYFVGINKELTHYPKMMEMHIDRTLGQLIQRHREVDLEVHALHKELKKYAKYSRFLHHAFVYVLNKHNFEKTKGFVEKPLDEEKLYVVQGWVPTNKLEELKLLVDKLKVYSEEIDLNENELMPTYLENKGASRIGEDLVNIYDIPSMADKDPSLWVLVSFALFFSMIIGDGGYGLILLLIALYIRNKHKNLKGSKKRFLDLFTILGYSCIAWGVLTTSFFGIQVAPDNPVRKVSLMSWLVEKKTEYHIQHQDEVYQEYLKEYPQLRGIKDPIQFLTVASKSHPNGAVVYNVYNEFTDHIMMELALFIGVIHIIVSMARYMGRNPSNIGWIIFLIGAYLYTPIFLGATSIVNFVFGVDKQIAADNGLYLVYGGMSLAVIIALIKHKWFGLIEATNVIQIFGDVLSYLRLYALGLSGALLTATMNEMSGSVPFVFGILILIFGHCINIVLAIMGGVIHGLRLNFLEWYHYSFEGGGKTFNPLRNLEIDE